MKLIIWEFVFPASWTLLSNRHFNSVLLSQKQLYLGQVNKKHLKNKPTVLQWAEENPPSESVLLLLMQGTHIQVHLCFLVSAWFMIKPAGESVTCFSPDRSLCSMCLRSGCCHIWSKMPCHATAGNKPMFFFVGQPGSEHRTGSLDKQINRIFELDFGSLKKKSFVALTGLV